MDLRYVIGFIYPITATIRTFLENSGYSDADVDKMYHAWFKSVTLQVSIWSYPYTTDDDW
ncbi:protoglobin domain-containing protein [Halocatena marina]|uniref:protoglobin domain-containing protein n=1 Tax=Halocatena marina TaxID=2934937 RepID=UPI0036211300